MPRPPARGAPKPLADPGQRWGVGKRRGSLADGGEEESSVSRAFDGNNWLCSYNAATEERAGICLTRFRRYVASPSGRSWCTLRCVKPPYRTADGGETTRDTKREAVRLIVNYVLEGKRGDLMLRNGRFMPRHGPAYRLHDSDHLTHLSRVVREHRIDGDPPL